MNRLAQSSLFKRILLSRWFLLAGFFVAAFLAFGYARAYYQDFKIKQEIRQLKEEVKTLEKKKLESLGILEYVMSDSFAEEKARTELHLKKPGERVIVIENSLRTEDGTVSAKDEGGQKRGNPLKWWYYFFPVAPRG